MPPGCSCSCGCRPLRPISRSRSARFASRAGSSPGSADFHPPQRKETSMINASRFLRRALLADAIFSGVSAVVLTLDTGALAPFLNLPEALLRETGLFLIAYAALVGWLGTRPSVQKALV